MKGKMGEEINGDDQTRLDRIEEQLKVLAQGHVQFQEDYRQMLMGLEVLHEPSQNLSDMQSRIHEALAQLAAAQRNADEKMAALMITVKLFRRPLQ